jgi:DNA primase
MSRIDEILQNLNTDDLINILGTSFSKEGHNYCGECPSGHDSKSGRSFMINTVDPTFHCFNCGASGNYIHAVEMKLYKSSSSGKGFTDNFKYTLDYLAERYGLASNVSTLKKDDTLLNILDLCVSIYSRALTEDVKLQLKERYGWDEDFIASERIGYGASCPSNELLEFFSKEELLETGLFNPTKAGGVFHIYQDRIVFPYTIGGRVRYTIGRKTSRTKWNGSGEAPKYFKQYTKKPEREYVSELIKNIIIKCQKDYSEVFITEGIADYLQLKRYGLNSMSAVTVQFKKEHYEQVISFCKKFKRVYICNDSDNNQAGQRGAARIAAKLIEAGILPYIVELPMAGDKMDVAEYVRDYGIEAFLVLKNKSITYIQMCLSSIPNNSDKLQLIETLSPIMNDLSYLDETTIHTFVHERIRDHFGMARIPSVVTQIRKMVIDIKNKREGEHKKSKGVFDEDVSKINMISSGQDYALGLLHYTVTRPEIYTDLSTGSTRVKNKAFIVNSNRDIKEIVDEQVISDTLILQRRLNSEYKADRWSFSNSNYSVSEYVNGHKEVSAAEVFNRIKDYFNRFIYFKNTGISSHLALVIMASYQYMAFHSVGYVHLWAEKRSGKTTALEIMSELGFNARMSSSISDAAIFRLIEMYRPLLLIDEAENLNPTSKQRDNSTSERLELYKSGYKKTGSATRCEGVNNVVTDFSNYCIKGFSSIKNLDSTLEDRTIIHEFKRMPADIKKEAFLPANHVEAFSEIRDMLHIYGLQYAAEVHEIYNSLDHYDKQLSEAKITHRTREIWAPYLSIAILIDKQSGSSVFDDQCQLAMNTLETKEAFSNDGGKPMQIVERFYEWVMAERERYIFGDSQKDIHLKDSIVNEFIRPIKDSDSDQEYAFLNYAYLKNLLRRHHIIDKDSEIPRIQLNGKRGVALHVSVERIVEALSTYRPDSQYARNLSAEISKLEGDLN